MGKKGKKGKKVNTADLNPENEADGSEAIEFKAENFDALNDAPSGIDDREEEHNEADSSNENSNDALKEEEKTDEVGDTSNSNKFVIVDTDDEDVSDSEQKEPEPSVMKKLEVKNFGRRDTSSGEQKVKKLVEIIEKKKSTSSLTSSSTKRSRFDSESMKDHSFASYEENIKEQELTHTSDSEENKALSNPTTESAAETSEILKETPPEASEMLKETPQEESSNMISKTPTQNTLEGSFTKQQSRGFSAEPHDLSYTLPTPRYKYVENEANKQKLEELTTNFVFGLAVVDFDHIKGPELTHWFDDNVNSTFEKESEPVKENLMEEKVKHYSKIWPYLAFQALPDGVHMYDETFTQFTLCYDELKKKDVELSFDLVDLVEEVPKEIDSVITNVSRENKDIVTNGETENSLDKLENNDDDQIVNIKDSDFVNNKSFENVDLSKEEDSHLISDSAALEKVTTRPVIEMEDPNQGVITLFGCACIRQLESALLKNIEEHENNHKRSVIQKSVILLTRAPLPIQLREKLSIITQSWFEQHDFNDYNVLKALYTDISNTYNKNGYLIQNDDLYESNITTDNKNDTNENCKILKESDFYMGLNFQDVVRKLRRNLLVLFKALILGNSKILFFSKDLNTLSNSQYCLIGLISNLLLSLSDSGFPLTDKHLHELKVKSKSLKSSDRSSILRFLGLPLNIFGFGSFFQPYLTLQQLSYITNINTRNFVVGSSNDIILEHKKEWFDLVVYLDEKESGLFGSGGCKIEILNKSLKDKVGLTWDDKKFIDYVIHSVTNHYSQIAKEEEKAKEDTISEEERIKSKTVNSNFSIDNGSYKGGNDFIRSQFEDYLIGFLSCVKYDLFLANQRDKGNEMIEQLKLDLYENDINKFNMKWVEEFKKSNVFKYWNEITEDELFNFFEPKHIGKHIGKETTSVVNNESTFKGSEVFKNWINKWKEPGDNNNTNTNNNNNSNLKTEDNKLGKTDDILKGGDDNGKAEGGENTNNEKNEDTTNVVDNGDVDRVEDTVKVTMNNFGRDVGLFFKKIGQQKVISGNGSGATTEEIKLNGLEDVKDNDAKDKGQLGAEDAKSPRSTVSETSENGNVLGDVKAENAAISAEEDKREEAGEDKGQAVSPFESKLRNLFQWKR